MKRSNPPITKLRDHIAWAICTFALNHIATKWYRDMISGSISLGLALASAAPKKVDPQ